MPDASSTVDRWSVEPAGDPTESRPATAAAPRPGSPPWLPALCLVPEVTDEVVLAIRSCFGEPALGWSDVRDWLQDSGVVDPGPDPQHSSLVLREEARASLEAALGEFVDDPASLARLLCCVKEWGEPALSATAAWALGAQRWDVLHELWRVVADDAAHIPDGVLAAYTDVPSEARRRFPTLTWASAVAQADAAGPGPGRTEVFLNRMIGDSALLHADWAQREDTDTAVFGGVLRMVGERHLPPSGAPLTAAWRTKAAIERHIDERSRQGAPPSQLAQSFFRVMSGQLAVHRADLAEAVAEARWGAILALGPSTSDLAAGIESLAHSLAGEGRGSPADATGAGLPSAQFRFGCLSQMAAVMSALARGREALERLDRAGVEEALAEVRRDSAAIAGLWATRVGIEAMHAAIWGDAPQGLNRLFAALADQSMGVREQDEPMSGLILGPARALLLSRVGAFAAATAGAETIDERFRTVVLARTLLWAGQLVASVRTMELTLPDPRLLHGDRLQLLVIRGAATALDDSITDDIAADTVTAARHLLLNRSYLPFAMLPRRACNAILALIAPLKEDPETAERFTELLDRLRSVRDGGGDARLVQLTEREAVLLPLLAGSASVPDIAKQLHVSVHTVRSQVATLREKFQASTRAELVRKAGAYGALSRLQP